MVIKIEHAAPTLAEGEKSLYIKSYGCQMNVYDGLRMAELLAPLGYRLSETPEQADLIVLNTCHIREKADDKLFSDIGRFRKQTHKSAIFAVGGCTGQALGAKIMQQHPRVNIVFGPQSYHHLPAMVAEILEGRQKRVLDTALKPLEKFDNLPKPGAYGPTAFVAIQEGCDKFCTYCVVPYTRGPEISRKADDIIREIELLAAQGVREVTLLGQNVNAYDENGLTLAKLCEKVGEINGIERIRFTTSHPANTGSDLIAAFTNNPKLMPYFHLPVQAGSDTILKAMNRAHTVASYLETINKIRAVRPDIAISGDFIVGFPGETEADFEQTLALAAHVGYFGAFSFAYSPRPGTPAAQMAGQIDEITKKERLAALQAVLDYTTEAYLKQFEGQTLPVLVEGPGGRPGQLRGRTPHNANVNFTVSPDARLPGVASETSASPTRPVAEGQPKAQGGLFPQQVSPASMSGQIVNVRITHAGPKALVGECVPT